METHLVIKKAKKNKLKLKVGITGISSSGKTYSALRLASGMGKNIIVIDTENDSASLYAGKFDFSVISLKPPYTVERYIEAIDLAESENPDVLIIDSISHQWSGQGGLLQQKEAMDARGGNSFQNWSKMTPKHEQFIAKLLHSPLNIICTIRSKADYVVEQNDKGRMAPKKVGLAPIQRDGFEYELSLVFDIAKDHNATAVKDRTGLFGDSIFLITEQTGVKLSSWANDGELEPSIKLPVLTQETLIDKAKQIVDATKREAVLAAIPTLADMVKGLERIEQILKEQSSGM